jgi:hypothetical protein
VEFVEGDGVVFSHTCLEEKRMQSYFARTLFTSIMTQRGTWLRVQCLLANPMSKEATDKFGIYCTGGHMTPIMTVWRICGKRHILLIRRNPGRTCSPTGAACYSGKVIVRLVHVQLALRVSLSKSSVIRFRESLFAVERNESNRIESNRINRINRSEAKS